MRNQPDGPSDQDEDEEESGEEVLKTVYIKDLRVFQGVDLS